MEIRTTCGDVVVGTPQELAQYEQEKRKIVTKPIRTVWARKKQKHKQKRRNSWTKEEDNFLRLNKHLVPSKLAKKMPGRTRAAIAARRNILGIFTHVLKSDAQKSRQFTKKIRATVRGGF